MPRKLHDAPADQARSSSASARQADIDTGISLKLQWYLQYFEEDFPAALADAISFCHQHSLFQRDDLTEDVIQLVSKVLTHARRNGKPPRSRKPKGSPTRRRKGRPAVPQVHVERHKQVEAVLEKMASKGEEGNVTAAARAAGGEQWDAFRKSYLKVEGNNLYASYYEPEYVDRTDPDE